MTDKSLVSIRP